MDGGPEVACEMPLERFAALSALIDAGGGRDAILGRVGLTPPEWTEVQRAWLTRMAGEARRMRFALQDRYNSLFLAHRSAIERGHDLEAELLGAAAPVPASAAASPPPVVPAALSGRLPPPPLASRPALGPLPPLVATAPAMRSPPGREPQAQAASSPWGQGRPVAPADGEAGAERAPDVAPLSHTFEEQGGPRSRPVLPFLPAAAAPPASSRPPTGADLALPFRPAAPTPAASSPRASEAGAGLPFRPAPAPPDRSASAHGASQVAATPPREPHVSVAALPFKPSPRAEVGADAARRSAPAAAAGLPFRSGLAVAPPPTAPHSQPVPTGTVAIEALPAELLARLAAAEAASRAGVAAAVKPAAAPPPVVATPPPPAPVAATPIPCAKARLTLEQFASITAELAVTPARRAEIEQRYGFVAGGYAQEQEAWAARFASDAAASRRYGELVREFRAWLKGRAT